MTVLVFGGLGHVASWVVHDLVQRGEDVAVIDAGAGNFDKLGLDYLAPLRDQFEIRSVDILDVPTLFEAMKSYDGKIDAVVFSVAVIAGPTFALRPYRNIEINTVGMLNVIEACRIFGVPKFVNLSSGAVYGNAASNQTETTPYMATDLYCATKIANEVLALQYGSTFGMDVRNARLMAVYGPGRLPSRMHALYQVLFGPLEGLRDLSVESGRDQALEWTHVRDTAQGVVAVLDAKMHAESPSTSHAVRRLSIRTLFGMLRKSLACRQTQRWAPASFSTAILRSTSRRRVSDWASNRALEISAKACWTTSTGFGARNKRR